MTARLLKDRDRGMALARELLNGEGSARNTQRTALIAFGLRIASAAVAYLSQVFLARWMGGFEYGVFVFVWVWVLILGGLSPLGLNVSIIRFIPEYAERGEFSRLRGLLFGGQLLVFISSTIVALAGLAGLYFFGHWLREGLHTRSARSATIPKSSSPRVSY